MTTRVTSILNMTPIYRAVFTFVSVAVVAQVVVMFGMAHVEGWSLAGAIIVPTVYLWWSQDEMIRRTLLMALALIYLTVGVALRLALVRL